MRKPLFLILPLGLLLLSCGANPIGSSSEASSEQTQVSSEEVVSEGSSSESVSELSDAERLTLLGKKLRSYEGHIASKKTNLTRTFVYPSDGYFGMVIVSEDTTTRYTRGDSYLVDSVGEETINPDDATESEPASSAAYHAQIFDDGKKYYSIRLYDDGTRTQKSIKTSLNTKEVIYDISYAAEEIDNFDAMIAYKEIYPDLIEYSFTNIDGKLSGDKLTYSYQFSSYEVDEDEDGNEGERYLSSRYTYTNTFTIKDGLITHLSQSYLSEAYAGDVCSSLEALSEVDYIQGDYQEYTGDVLETSKKDTD